MDLTSKKIDELTIQEMAYVHLSLDYQAINVKNFLLRSTLSFINQNIQHGLTFDNSKHLMPYLSLCAILDQLGICYNLAGATEPRFSNGIKRCLVIFGGYDADDEIISTLYALRNGLLHNISLTSKSRFSSDNFIFAFDNSIETIYRKSEIPWNGDYDLLNGARPKYTTLINVNLFRDLVNSCILKAQEFNSNSQLQLRLTGGVKQLFYDYIRPVEMQSVMT